MVVFAKPQARVHPVTLSGGFKLNIPSTVKRQQGGAGRPKQSSARNSAERSQQRVASSAGNASQSCRSTPRSVNCTPRTPRGASSASPHMNKPESANAASPIQAEEITRDDDEWEQRPGSTSSSKLSAAMTEVRQLLGVSAACVQRGQRAFDAIGPLLEALKAAARSPRATQGCVDEHDFVDVSSPQHQTCSSNESEEANVTVVEMDATMVDATPLTVQDLPQFKDIEESSSVSPPHRSLPESKFDEDL